MRASLIDSFFFLTDLIQGLVRAKHELSTVLCPRLCHKTIAQLTYSSQNTQFRSIDRLGKQVLFSVPFFSLELTSGFHFI